jgi:Protein of unknown function (DUF2939)
MGKSKLFAAAIIAVLLVGGWYWGSPFWTLRQMRDAAQSKDVDALASHVDFPALREDVKAELTASFMTEMGKDQGGLGGLGKAFGLAMADKMVDGMISPAGLRVMFAGADVADGPQKAGPKLGMDDVEIERSGLSEFRLKSTKTGDDKPVLVFHRDGLSWKLAGIDLPQKGQ